MRAHLLSWTLGPALLGAIFACNGGEPTPVEAKVISPGLALAAATRSFIVLNGDSARTTIKVVFSTTLVIGAKSLIES